MCYRSITYGASTYCIISNSIIKYHIILVKSVTIGVTRLAPFNESLNMHLTDREIKTAKSIAKDSFLSDGLGLYLRIRTSGTKTWLYRYKICKATKWLELGNYPNLSLSEARLKCQESTALKKLGVDPVEKHKSDIRANLAESAESQKRITVNDLYLKWLSLELSSRKDSGLEVKRAFEKDVLPKIGKLIAEDVTKKLIGVIVDEILARGSNRMAKVIFSNLRQMFRFALDRDIVKTDPTASIRKSKIGTPDTPRERVLNENEIIELRNKIPSAKLSLSVELSIWIAISTGCRIGELIQAKWSDVKLLESKWEIPSEVSKNGKPITIYLSNFAKKQFEVLREISDSSVWCYPNRDDTDHLNTKAITKQIGDRQISLEKEPLKNRSKNSQSLLLSNGKWTPHDLRRTAATLMTTLGVLPDIADRCLNHVEQNRIRRTYIQNSYEEEKKEAWRKLGEKIGSILTPTP
jgi:integrase